MINLIKKLLGIKPEPDSCMLSHFVKATPNCAVCKWKLEDQRFDIESTPGQFLVNVCYLCSAQGAKDADECWNNEECKALFSDRTFKPEVYRSDIFRSKDTLKAGDPDEFLKSDDYPPEEL